MIKIKVNDKINQKDIENLDQKDVEKHIKEKISNRLTEQIMKNIDEMEFVQLDYDPETNTFVFDADIVLSSAKQIETSIQMVVQNLINKGIGGINASEILKPLSENMRGW